MRLETDKGNTAEFGTLDTKSKTEASGRGLITDQNAYSRNPMQKDSCNRMALRYCSHKIAYEREMMSV